MKLKEIKPGMIIHCKNDDEKKALLEEAERLGYVWYSTKEKPTEKSVHDIGNTIHFYDAGTNSFSADYKHITHSCEIGNTEFSDLIVPELTAEEVLQIATDICNISDCDNGCPLAAELDDFTKQCMICPKSLKTYSETVPIICQQWKSEHERKEPEIETEWFWQGRIFKIHEDGCYYQIKDGTGVYDTGCEYQESAEEYMDNELKEYCKTHEGNYIAKVERICRVKAVE